MCQGGGGGGTGDGNPGVHVNGAESIWEAGDEMVGSKIPKVAGTRRNRIAEYFAIEKAQRGRNQNGRDENKITRYGKRKVQTPPVSPPPLKSDPILWIRGTRWLINAASA